MEAITQTSDNSEAQPPAVNSEIVVNHDKNVDLTPFKFNFRSVTDEETQTTTKRPSIELKLPIPSLEGIAAILMGGDAKQQALLIEAVTNIIGDAARDYVNDNTSVTAETFDVSKITFEAIANQEQEARKSRAIDKEAWKAFSDAYIAHIPGTVNTTKDKAALHVKFYVGKFNSLVGHPNRDSAIDKFLELLTIFTTTHPKAEEHEQVLTYLMERAKKIKSAKPADLLDSLGFAA
jgi:hypothetical protein